jgi:hypothetical protein
MLLGVGAVGEVKRFNTECTEESRRTQRKITAKNTAETQRAQRTATPERGTNPGLRDWRSLGSRFGANPSNRHCRFEG